MQCIGLSRSRVSTVFLFVPAHVFAFVWRGTGYSGLHANGVDDAV